MNETFENSAYVCIHQWHDRTYVCMHTRGGMTAPLNAYKRGHDRAYVCMHTQWA